MEGGCIGDTEKGKLGGSASKNTMVPRVINLICDLRIFGSRILSQPEAPHCATRSYSGLHSACHFRVALSNLEEHCSDVQKNFVHRAITSRHFLFQGNITSPSKSPFDRLCLESRKIAPATTCFRICTGTEKNRCLF